MGKARCAQSYDQARTALRRRSACRGCAKAGGCGSRGRGARELQCAAGGGPPEPAPRQRTPVSRSHGAETRGRRFAWDIRRFAHPLTASFQSAPHLAERW